MWYSLRTSIDVNKAIDKGDIVRPRISEFSFGYALTEEIVNLFRHVIIGAPVFPSLYDEGRDGGGYDLRLNRIGVPLFLQFKLTHQMIRRNASEIRVDHLFADPPFLRMYLMPRRESHQHRMLLDLDDGINDVFYAAPYFYTQTDLNTAYVGRRVIQNSFFVKPRDIGRLLDDEEHHIALRAYSLIGYFCSEPKKFDKIINSERFILSIKDKLIEKEQTMIKMHMKKLYFQMVGIIREYNLTLKEYREYEDLIKENKLAQYLFCLARSYFDSELLFVYRDEQ